MFGDPSAHFELRYIKLIHTFAWTVFASAIVAIPLVTMRGALGWAVGLSALVWMEILVLSVSGMRCPLTGLAEHYTDDRSDNFDIFLPNRLARNNKLIFGSLFTVAELFLLYRWLAL